MPLIGPGTWEAARAAADCALTAVDLVLGGAPVAYACCRPPGHHVCRGCYGGSCYLNNAAVAGRGLAPRGDWTRPGVGIQAAHRQGRPGVFLGREGLLAGSGDVDTR